MIQPASFWDDQFCPAQQGLKTNSPFISRAIFTFPVELLTTKIYLLKLLNLLKNVKKLLERELHI